MRVLLSAIALGLAAQGISQAYCESAITDRPNVTVLLRAPQPMNNRELGAWQIFAQGVFDLSADFTRREFYTYGAQGGIPPRVWWTNDFISVQFWLPAGGENLCARLADAVLREHRIDEEVLPRLRANVSGFAKDDWTAALYTARGDVSVDSAFLNRFFQRALRPENTTISADPKTIELIRNRLNGWQVPRVQQDLRAGPKNRFSSPETANITAAIGKPFLPTANNGPSMLAAVALGAGKSSTVYQVCRVQQQWSYRQEFFLWPTVAGWQPRLLLGGSLSSPAIPEIKSKLKEAVGKWQLSDLERARNLVSASMEGGIPIHPFWCSSVGPFNGTDEQCADWTALMATWGVRSAAPEDVVINAKTTNLQELKSAAEALIDQLQPEIR